MPEITYPARAFLIERRQTHDQPAVAKPVNVALCYSTDDPYVVLLRWTDGRTWTVSRQQLYAGTMEPACTPTISVMPLLNMFIEITLRAEDCEPAVLSFVKADVHRVLKLSQQYVPFGRELERLDLDGELARLVDGECPA